MVAGPVPIVDGEMAFDETPVSSGCSNVEMNAT
jgi:hypothetical protein